MKWEYCVIPMVTMSYGKEFTKPQIWFPKPDGCEFHYLTVDSKPPKDMTDEKRMKDVTKRTAAVMETIARLGEEGWELTGCGYIGGAFHMLYFKRPKQET